MAKLTRFGGKVTPGASGPCYRIMDSGGKFYYVVCLEGKILIFGINSDGMLSTA